MVSIDRLGRGAVIIIVPTDTVMDLVTSRSYHSVVALIPVVGGLFEVSKDQLEVINCGPCI